MKQLSTILVLSIMMISAAYGSTDPVPLKSSKTSFLVESAKVEVTFDDSFNQEFLLDSNYNEITDAIEFKTSSQISFIQIFNGDELEFQLPVMSDIVKIGTSVFGKGDYKLGFMIEGESEIQFTDVKIK